MVGTLRRLCLVLPVAIAAAFAGCSGKSSDTNAASDAGDASSTDDASGEDLDAGSAPDTSGPVSCATDKASDGLFGHLSCTGFYTDIAQKTVAPENVAYTPGVEFWSDGAVKHRWLALPPSGANGKIDTTDIDNWIWPVGTKAWKELTVDGHRTELRLYAKMQSGWVHTTYVWNADESEAVRLDSGKLVDRSGGLPKYEIPSHMQCTDCHAGQKDQLLGLEAVNLALATAQGITLSSLASDGRLSVPPPATSVAFPEDATGKAAAALAWMHVNCGPCHNTRADANAQRSNVFMLAPPSMMLGAQLDGGAPLVTDLPAWTTTYKLVSDRTNPDGGAQYMLLQPGDPSTSLISVLSGERVPDGQKPSEKTQMPPEVSHLVDTVGHQKLDDWISALPP